MALTLNVSSSHRDLSLKATLIQKDRPGEQSLQFLFVGSELPIRPILFSFNNEVCVLIGTSATEFARMIISFLTAYIRKESTRLEKARAGGENKGY